MLTRVCGGAQLHLEDRMEDGKSGTDAGLLLTDLGARSADDRGRRGRRRTATSP